MGRRWFSRNGLPLLLIGVPIRRPARTGGSSVARAAVSVSTEQALNRYCASCHNEKAKQGNFVLSTLDVGNVGQCRRWSSWCASFGRAGADGTSAANQAGYDEPSHAGNIARSRRGGDSDPTAPTPSAA
jgi:hypothetical protein